MNNSTSTNRTVVDHDPVSDAGFAQPANQLNRRTFLRNVTITAAALVANGCGGGAGGATLAGDNSSAPPPGQSPSAPPGQSPTSNRPPVWSVIPTITFTQGIASSFSIAAFVTDEENDALSITKNAVALPAGVTYDAATRSFIYDGIGGIASTGGHVLTASEG
ncbi:MAG TPA: hypothetical protein VGU61_01505 [Noviherbaspirillum sp.]|uniref:hypothetical protein n=1 Tax=Noviherbaspirillum sp. TaxID=1926288 RepID=UPI002DDD06E9|nr:hypothetical protein [Noviherbaspirillum sp.]HEV2608914.1 hypothetical protein [Noviherbaspirillum sp.]